MVAAVDPEIMIGSRSARVRRRYIEHTERATTRGLIAESGARGVLERSVAWLELFYMSALIWEFMHENGIDSIEQFRAHAEEADQFVRATFPGMGAAEQLIQRSLGDLSVTGGDAPDSGWMSIDWSQVVRSFDAVAAECPIENLEDLGRQIDEPGLAHRGRNAYDALRAFVRRHDPASAEIMRIVGEQYRRGHVRMNEVAQLLGMATSDAVFELEQRGFSRSVDAIMLSDSEREAAYARLRQRRLERDGKSVVNPELVERDVIASERIESVDARAWIRGR